MAKEPLAEDDEAAIERWAHQVIADAAEVRASDLHLDPRMDGVRLRFRIDGAMHDVLSWPHEIGLRILRYFKVHAGFDPAPSRSPEDGRVHFELDGRAVDLRIACGPCVGGDKLTMRLHRRSPVTLRLKELGMPKEQRQIVEGWLEAVSGMFVVAGPVGSGKTTTLYAMLAELELAERHIVTIEDPVEYHLDSVNQFEINRGSGMDFDSTLRAVFRHDPDFLLFGEIRDHETARAAMEAAGSGRVVLTTMHSRSTASTVTTLRSLGIGDHEIAASLAFVVAQRLVRRLCPKCRKAGAPTETERRWLKDVDRPVPEQAWHPQGCDECDGTGYRERTGLFEVVPIQQKIYDQILDGADEQTLRRGLREFQAGTMIDAGLAKAVEGITTIRELTRLGMQGHGRNA